MNLRKRNKKQKIFKTLEQQHNETIAIKKCRSATENALGLEGLQTQNSARELYRQSGRRRSAKLVPTFADRGVSRGQRNGSPQPLISDF